MDDTSAAVFPQKIHWEDKGTSRIPFMAYTEADQHRREQSRLPSAGSARAWRYRQSGIARVSGCTQLPSGKTDLAPAKTNPFSLLQLQK
jgi:hypothetical protein